MFRKTEAAFLFLSGGILYNLIEILWRGHTHWTMTVAGGLCLLLVHWVNLRYASLPLFARCGFDALLITAVELGVGVVCNLVLGLGVWDYSSVPGNLWGQVCPLFTFFWFLLSIPACGYSHLVHRVFTRLAEAKKAEETSENYEIKTDQT